MAARRAGVSSMPLKPISASPRSMDWSIDVKVMLMKLGLPSEPAGDELGDFDVETDELVRSARDPLRRRARRLQDRRPSGIRGAIPPARRRRAAKSMSSMP